MSEHSDIDDFYYKIGNLSHIMRYNDVYCINRESVAEHSFFVASIVMKLHESYHFNLGVALAMAITHDWPEAVIGDITVKVKKAFPGIADAVSEAEREVMSRHFSFSEAYWDSFEDNLSIEARIAHYADVLQCLYYSDKEIKLGNKGYMHTVHTSTLQRLEVMEYALHEYKKEKLG